MGLLLIVLSARAIFRFIQVVSGRIAFPYDLEWMEGGMVDHMLRVRQGLPLYVEPSFDFTPFIYNPLFYWLGAAASYAVGAGPLALRVVSVLSVVGLCLALFWLLRKQGNPRWASFVAVGVFLGTYELSGGWMDIARVDATFLALQSGALCFALSERPWALWGAVALVCLAFLAKQYALVVAAPIALYYLFFQGIGRAALFGGATILVTGGMILSLNAASEGWFWFWTVQVPAGHQTIMRRWPQIFYEILLHPAPLIFFVCLMGALGLVQQVAARPPGPSEGVRRERARAVLLLSFILVLFIQAWASFNHAGSYLNCLMPMHWGLALLVGVTLGSASRDATSLVRFALMAVTSLQLQLWDYSPRRWVPKPADRREGERIEANLTNEPGAILLGFRGFFGSPGANPRHAHQMAVGDLFNAGRPDLTEKVKAEARAHFAKRAYSSVVLDNYDYVFMDELKANYRKMKEVPLRKGDYWTLTGSTMKPRIFFEPKGSSR